MHYCASNCTKTGAVSFANYKTTIFTSRFFLRLYIVRGYDKILALVEKGEVAMCVMLDMPPAMEQEAKDFAAVQGTTLERILLDYLKHELAKRKETEEWEAEFDRLVESSSSRLVGEKPYKFCRADAYSAGEFA